MAEPQKTGMWYQTMSRRKFLEVTTLTGASLALAPVIAACTPSAETQKLLEAMNETPEQKRYRDYCGLDIDEARARLEDEGLENYGEAFSANHELITTLGAGLFPNINDVLLDVALGNDDDPEAISILRDDWVESPRSTEMIEDARAAIDEMDSDALDASPDLKELFHGLADGWGLQFLLMNGFDIDPNITAGLTHYLGLNAGGRIVMGDMPSPQNTQAIEDYLYILLHELNHNIDGWHGMNLPRIKIIKKYIPQLPVASYMTAYAWGVYDLLQEWQGLAVGTAVNKYNPIHVANHGIRSSSSDTTTSEIEKEVIDEELKLWTGALGRTIDDVADEIGETNPTNKHNVYTQKGHVAHRLARKLFALKEASKIDPSYMEVHNKLIRNNDLQALIFGKAAGDIRFESLVQTAGHRFVYARHSGEFDFYEGVAASLTDPYHESVDNARIQVFASPSPLPSANEYAMTQEDDLHYVGPTR